MEKENLAQGVKDLRKRKGLSQEDLAKESGLSLRTIQRVENGESEPTGETLKRISSVLNITPDELIYWDSDKETLRKTVKTKYDYLHIYDDKLLLTKTKEISDLVEDYGVSVNTVFKTLMVFFIGIPIFTTLSVIFYNLEMTGLAIYSGGFAFCFLVVAFYTILFTSGSSVIKKQNITKVKIKKRFLNNVVLISHQESGRLKVRGLVFDENQIDTVKNALLSKNFIQEKNINLKRKNVHIYLFFVVVFLFGGSGQFSKLFFKEVDPMMINGFIILFVSVLLLLYMIFRLINPLDKKQQTANNVYSA